MGTILGIGIYMLGYGIHIQDIILMSGFPEVLYMSIMVILVAYVFLKKQQNSYVKKLKNMRLLAAGIAHEIRTPLASLICNINSLQKEKEEEEYTSETISDISLNIRQCHYIMNSILLNLKDNYSVYTSINNAHQLVSDSISEYPLEEQDRESVFISIDKKLQIAVDPLLFKQVVFNLLNNALFYIKKKGVGKVYIYAKQHKNKVSIFFKDTGFGIAPHKINTIFQAFNSTSSVGNGIGLAFCKYVILKMNGTIKCNSVYGKYTKFSIIFSNEKLDEK
jgi:two-component system autoinducer 1 sensor kinase/phosphatase LuxN